MEPLPKIPSPSAHQWREFRIRAMPAVVFFAAAIVAVMIWKDHVVAPTVYGEVEAVQAHVSCPKGGTLSRLNITRFQLLATGDVVGDVHFADPKILASAVAGSLGRFEFCEPDMKCL